MDDFFRSFFSLPPRRDHSGRDDSAGQNEGSMDGMENFGSSLNVFFPHDIFKHVEEMVSSMEQVMKLGDDEQQLFSLEAAPPHETDDGGKISPRDQMLKDDSERETFTGGGFTGVWPRVWDMERDIQVPSKREDTDLDTIATKSPADLERILSLDSQDEQRVEAFRKKPWQHWSSSFSSVTVRGADGRYEQKETRRDREGNTETVTRHSLEGRSCLEKVTRDKSGCVLESSTDCTADLLKRSQPLSDGTVLRKAPNGSYAQPNADDVTVFRNIFGSDVTRETDDRN